MKKYKGSNIFNLRTFVITIIYLISLNIYFQYNYENNSINLFGIMDNFQIRILLNFIVLGLLSFRIIINYFQHKEKYGYEITISTDNIIIKKDRSMYINIKDIDEFGFSVQGKNTNVLFIKTKNKNYEMFFYNTKEIIDEIKKIYDQHKILFLDKEKSKNSFFGTKSKFRYVIQKDYIVKDKFYDKTSEKY
jgi:hypothetical protein